MVENETRIKSGIIINVNVSWTLKLQNFVAPTKVNGEAYIYH